ncbi:lipopolysaccharide biosynthesis protein [Paludibacter sp. 221]|uniref:glycosyl transferase family 90 n=1 Tax=Paludibacter sp. 221 TaxID=2302939 RepID=UPI0013D18E0C|nr:glycosyl transferase family 90 [Paludibacter sp. 221]NDV47113.1 lipopolysaccharide biosynthesis protein [Paludibacter sp. 221]
MLQDIKRASFKHKNNKLAYYVKNYVRLCRPFVIFRRKPDKKLTEFSPADKEYIEQRVNYYNKLTQVTNLPDSAIQLGDFKLKEHQKTYFFDTYEYTRYFSQNLRICPLYGDITHVPDYPCITKSRPISEDNANSVLLKLDKIRHFLFLKDKNDFIGKKDMLVGRSKAHQEHRVRFLNMYRNHPMCDVGQVNRDKNHHLIANRLTMEEHLKYKFILCLEGNDVASNLKWVMSSNSLAVMPKPKYETWFMEAQLIPDYHYVLIKDDFSDLEERMRYYIDHPDEALQIISNAHKYIEQFKDKKREDLISLLVLNKYFEMTNQKP